MGASSTAMGTRSDGIVLAVGFHRSPLLYPELTRSDVKLPPGAGLLLRIAAGDDELLRQASRAHGIAPREIFDAATFFVRQAFFARDADHYRVMGLPSTATTDDVKEHYRLLMKMFHPDRGGTEEQWIDQFAVRVNGAYTVLRNQEARAVYDLTARGRRAGSPPEPDRSGPLAGRRQNPAKMAPVTDSLVLPLFVRRHFPQLVLGTLAVGSVIGVGGMFALEERPVAGIGAIGAPIASQAAERSGFVRFVDALLGRSTGADEVAEELNRWRDAKLAAAQSAATTVDLEPSPKQQTEEAAAKEEAPAPVAAPVLVAVVSARQPEAVPPVARLAPATVEVPRTAGSDTPAPKVSPSMQTSGSASAGEAKRAPRPATVSRPAPPRTVAADGVERSAPVPRADRSTVTRPPPARTPAETPREPAAPPATTTAKTMVATVAEPPAADAGAGRTTAGQQSTAAATNAPAPPTLDDLELERLIGRFVIAYEKGDLEQFMSLFHESARTGEKGDSKNTTRTDYANLFFGTQARRMMIDELQWEKSGDGAKGLARFVVRVMARDGRQVSEYAGGLRMEVAQMDGALTIRGLWHTVKSSRVVGEGANAWR